MNAEKKYLFVLCGPYSGSTALWKLLSTSSNVSSFHTEGQQLESLKNILFTSDRWDPEKSIPWQKVKECWEGEWDLKKPVLLEKSPAHLCRALKIEKFFPNSFFIIMYRDPYASAEAFKRRHGWDCKRAAEFWIQVMKCQQKNIENLKENIHFSYEDFTGDPETVCRKIVEFMPELGDMDLKT